MSAVIDVKADFEGMDLERAASQDGILAAYVDMVEQICENAKIALDDYHYRKLVAFMIEETAARY